MKVTLENHGSFFRVTERLPSNVMTMIGHECSYLVQDYEHILRNQRIARNERTWGRYKEWDGRKRLFHAGRRVFPMGLLPRVLSTLVEYGYDAKVEVRRDQGPQFAVPDWPAYRYQPRDYQDEAVAAILSKHYGVLRVATGGGKTLIAGRIIRDLRLFTLFLVHTKDLLYQAKDVFEELFGADIVGQLGDGVFNLAPITVATMQTVSRVFGIKYESIDEDASWQDDELKLTYDHHKHVREYFASLGIVFMDECHRVAAPTAIDVMAELVAPVYRVGLSASPWRDDGADLAIEACLGPTRYDVSASQLFEMGYLVQPIIRMLAVPAMDVTRRYESAYAEYIVDNEDRNRLGIRAALGMHRRGRQVMILVRQIRHGEAIQKMVSDQLGAWVPFLSGRDSSTARGEVLDRMRSGRLGMLVASTIADEGLDIRPLSGLVLLGGGKSSVKALQRVGRTLRPWKGKKNAEIVDFEDHAKWLIDHSVARRRLYEMEPQWIVTDV